MMINKWQLYIDLIDSESMTMFYRSLNYFPIINLSEEYGIIPTYIQSFENKDKISSEDGNKEFDIISGSENFTIISNVD